MFVQLWNFLRRFVMHRGNVGMNDAQNRGKTIATLLDDTGLRALEEYMLSLPVQPSSFPPVIGTGLGGYMKEHSVAGGTSLCWSLLDLPGVSVAKWFASSGSSFPLHAHDQTEWLAVYQGSMIFTAGEKETVLLPGSCVRVLPGVSHMKRFTEDCFFLAVTVPRCPDWPVATWDNR